MDMTLRSNSTHRVIVCIVLSVFLALSLLPLSVFAANNGVTEEAAMKNLTTYVYSRISSNEYKLADGGYIYGRDLFVRSDDGCYDLDEGTFSELSGSSQQEVVSDIAQYSEEAVDLNDGETVTDDGKTYSQKDAKGVEETTVETWWSQLQTKNGVGSRFMTTILDGTKPDFVSAKRIYEPFSGPISIAIGVVAVALMSLLGLSMVSDIAYITLPPVRLFVSEKGGKGEKVARSYIFTYDAITAIEQAENGDGAGKQALGIYLKRRIGVLILLGICLLYLVHGSIYTAVGWVLDLLNGFLGF